MFQYFIRMGRRRLQYYKYKEVTYSKMQALYSVVTGCFEAILENLDCGVVVPKMVDGNKGGVVV